MRICAASVFLRAKLMKKIGKGEIAFMSNLVLNLIIRMTPGEQEDQDP